MKEENKYYDLRYIQMDSMKDLARQVTVTTKHDNAEVSRVINEYAQDFSDFPKYRRTPDQVFEIYQVCAGIYITQIRAVNSGMNQNIVTLTHIPENRRKLNSIHRLVRSMLKLKGEKYFNAPPSKIKEGSEKDIRRARLLHRYHLIFLKILDLAVDISQSSTELSIQRYFEFYRNANDHQKSDKGGRTTEDEFEAYYRRIQGGTEVGGFATKGDDGRLHYQYDEDELDKKKGTKRFLASEYEDKNRDSLN